MVGVLFVVELLVHKARLFVRLLRYTMAVKYIMIHKC